MSGRPNRVLIIDRDPVARKLLFQYIWAKGWDAVAAADPAQALQCFSAGAFRIVLTGVESDGWAEGVRAAEAMVQADPQVRMALMTVMSPDEGAARRAGFSTLLVKPVRACELDALLRPMPAGRALA